MVVQHNLIAMNTNRQLGITTKKQTKSSEKLSSGYRINRSADDAAGLTISEKMRSQIRGLNQASDNAENGISLIQSAEGALNEVHSILQRMNELAVQGGNDTNQTIDRNAINQELRALTDELDRISETTQFNKQNLLDGTYQDKKLQIGANGGQSVGINIDKMDAKALGLKDFTYAKGEAYTRYGTIVFEGTTYEYNNEYSVGYNSNAFVEAARQTGKAAFTDDMVYFNDVAGKFTVGGTNYDSKEEAIAAGRSALGVKYASAAGTRFQSLIADVAFSAETVGGFGSDVTMKYPSVDSYNTANATIQAVQGAISKVSVQRSALGALQNRLEHTVANLDTVSENTSAAESRIRDTDMADEMVEYSKNNILAQAGQSMLAQANQITQGVVNLLQ